MPGTKQLSNLQHLEAKASFITNLYDRAMAGIPVLDGRDGLRDIDRECGHPDTIKSADYMRMYRRGDVAKRVVNLEPDECWKDYPSIYETEEERETPFEKAVDKVIVQTKLYSYLHRLDRVSGIGRYAVMFIGLDDGEDFETPAPGYDDAGPTEVKGAAKVLYYRIFGESSAEVQAFESDRSNPRFGQPKYYTLAFEDVVNEYQTALTLGKVHWSRVVHVADNLIESELLGAPRMEDVYNRLLDLRKISGGSAEMFWKGGFPGLSFEVDPKQGEFDADQRAELREDVRLYAEGLQRYITMVGVTVKSLAPQISDPTNCTNNLLTLIAITKGIPQQSFKGSQQGQLDSPQDTITWRERIMLRKERHVTPNIIRVTIDRFIQYGVLPVPTEQLDQPLPYIVRWEPMAALSEAERAQVAKDLTEALARYATAGAEALVPLGEWLGKFCGFTAQQVKAVENAESSRKSLVFEQLDGMSGSAGGNVPSSTPKVPKGDQKKDPSKTPTNQVQKSK
jgi:hypothetical protein